MANRLGEEGAVEVEVVEVADWADNNKGGNTSRRSRPEKIFYYTKTNSANKTNVINTLT